MILDKARSVIEEESRALKRVAGSLDNNFEKAVRIILDTRGKVIVIGLGKSGLVGRKIAATLSSTGSPALFLHAAESLHGDIGVIDREDTAVLLSYSGKTDEIKVVLDSIKRIDIPVIAITGNCDSELSSKCDAVIMIDIEKEACPMNLVPTTSTTAMLAIGDALAITLLQEKGFKEEDFAVLHPGGILGKKLLLKVDDIIKKSGSNPVVREGCSVKDALLEMSASRVGATSIVDTHGRLTGYFTDGDLRRHIQKDTGVLEKKIEEIMTRNPSVILSGSLALEAREILRNNSFDNVPVVDSENRPVGIIDERDIIREGL